MKESRIDEVILDINNLVETTRSPQNTLKEKSKYYISFSSEYEVFEDTNQEIIYENDNGELLLDIINKKDKFFEALIEYATKTKENINTIQDAVVVNLFDNYQYIEKLREDLEKNKVNQSIINMLCDDLSYHVNSYMHDRDAYMDEYNSNKRDELDLEELLNDEERLKQFVELDEFKDYFEHDKNDLKGVKREIRDNISLIEEANHKIIERSNNLLSEVLNYLYSVMTFFIIVDKQIDRKTKNKEGFEELLIEPLNIPRSETIFEKMPDSRKNKGKLEGQIQIVTKYEISSLDELLNIYIRDMMENRITIKKCENCGRYFLPVGRQIYCEGCKTISYDVRKNNDEIKVLYRNNYKNQHNKMRRAMEKDGEAQRRFNNWNSYAKNLVESCEAEKITIEELENWFKNNSKLKNW